MIKTVLYKQHNEKIDLITKAICVYIHNDFLKKYKEIYNGWCNGELSFYMKQCIRRYYNENRNRFSKLNQSEFYCYFSDFIRINVFKIEQMMNKDENESDVSDDDYEDDSEEEEVNIKEDFYVYDNYDTPLITQEILDDLDNAIVIYPEGIKYNPLNAKNVVRWVLGPPRNEDTITYSKSDLIYWWMDYYYIESLGYPENILQISEFHEDIFKDVNYKRNGSCYSIRKANPKQLIHPNDSIFIPFNAAGDLTSLSELFNKTERFYCYDNYTFLYTQAAMCGCLSIVIPDGVKTKEEWLEGSPFNKYGIAYGNSENEILRANYTKHLVKRHIEKINDSSKDSVQKFIEYWNDKIK